MENNETSENSENPENQEKLNWIERLSIRRVLRKGKRIIRKFKEDKELQNQENTRQKLLISIRESLDVLEIETDEGQGVTRETILTYTNEELIKLLEEIITKMEKIT